MLSFTTITASIMTLHSPARDEGWLWTKYQPINASMLVKGAQSDSRQPICWKKNFPSYHFIFQSKGKLLIEMLNVFTDGVVEG